MNFSTITHDLFIGTTPHKKDYDQLRGLGIRLVINMRLERMPYKDAHPSPMQTLWLPSFDSPLAPISIRYLTRGARAALDVIAQGGRVYAHCAHGVHRGVAMGVCILIAQGMGSLDAMRLVKEKRPRANPYMFYIRRRILKFAQEWNA